MNNTTLIRCAAGLLCLCVFAGGTAEPLLAQSTRFSDDGDNGDFRQWRERSSSLRRKISALDDDAVEKLPMPILFGIAPAGLSRNFGDPRSSGRKHEGLDIMAPRRALIVSPTEAVVIRVGVGESSGNYVYTANPGGETFAYMHLDEMSELDEGDELEPGDFIGYVGNTGNASGGATHLHFEVRPDDEPTDPYPRLTAVFTPAQKVSFLEQILDDADDEEATAALIAKTYRSELLQAKAQNVELPDEVEEALATLPVATVATSVSVAAASASGNLSLGSRGPAVAALQRFLMLKNVGSANRVTADGSFGPITKAALADYQRSVGLAPDGHYGPLTRAYVTAHS